jgi:hypothetical protein
MRELSFEQIEEVQGGRHTRAQHAGCAAIGLAMGIASGFNPLVGGLATLSCYLLHSETSET